MFRLLPFFFLACASSPSTYNQSALPVAPPFNPITDAPITTGQPGYVDPQQEYPRSPHKRVLPPTKEPGLWAGDGPQASASREPTLLGVKLPYPGGASTEVDKYPVSRCAETLGAAVAHLAATARALTLPPDAHRPCVAASLLLQCLTDEADSLARGARRGRRDVAEEKRYARALSTARAFFSKECGSRIPVLAEVEYTEAVITEWQTIKGNVQ